MITTVTLNPCIDKTVTVPFFVKGGMNHIQSVKRDFAGKGINVSKAVVHLGHETTTTGFLFEDEADAAMKCFEDEGIKVDSVVCEGILRTNMKIFDLSTKKITEINEPGYQVTEQNVHEVIQKIEEYSKKSAYIVLSGSIPPRCPTDIYKRIIEKCKPHCKVVLDTSGEALKSGIKGKPHMIKVKHQILENLFQREFDSLEAIKEASLSLCKKGVDIVCVSLGGDGALMTDGKHTYFSPIVQDVDVKGTVGAGDSMVAAILTGFLEKKDLRECFRRAVAAATSAVTQPGSGVVVKEQFPFYLEKVEVDDI